MTLSALRASSPTLDTAPLGVLHIIVGYTQYSIHLIQKKSVSTYDIRSQELTSRVVDTDLPTKVLEAYVVSDRIFVLQSHREGSVIGFSVALNGGEVKSHNTVINRRCAGGIPFNEVIYFVGGVVGSGNTLAATHKCERYGNLISSMSRHHDPSLETLTEIAPLSSPRYSAGGAPIISAVHNGLIYVFGGLRMGGDVYDPSKDTWKTTVTPYKETYPTACVVVNSNIILFSAENSEIYRYLPDVDVWLTMGGGWNLFDVRHVYYNDGTMWFIGNGEQKEILIDSKNKLTLGSSRPTIFPSGSHIAIC